VNIIVNLWVPQNREAAEQLSNFQLFREDHAAQADWLCANNNMNNISFTSLFILLLTELQECLDLTYENVS
jgi:hypothetical protein